MEERSSDGDGWRGTTIHHTEQHELRAAHHCEDMDLWEQCPPEIEERITAASSIQILFEENMRYDRPSWSEPKAWLGTQAYKLLYIVVLVEVFCGVGRLSTTMEGALPDCSVIRIGYAYGHDLGLPLHRWYFQWPVRALCPAHVWFSWPCT